jgi:segregation and condensation protein B
MSEVDNKVKMIVEGLLLAAGRPLSLDNIIAVFSDDEKPDKKELKDVMESIADSCDDRGFELIEVASGYRFQVKQEISEWVAKLWEERPPRYTRALLETLALVAYRQPITRGDIEEIRGVAVSPNIIRTLLDREWIRVVGHRDVPGRPAMFATTKQFLDYFNLKSLQELPPLSEVKALDAGNKEVDLTEELFNQRVLDIPEDAVDENAIELSDEEKAELLAEEEAIELAKKPLDEILQDDPAKKFAEAELDDDEDGEAGEGDEDESVSVSAEDDDTVGEDEEDDLADDDWEEDAELAETEAMVDAFDLSDHQPAGAHEESDAGEQLESQDDDSQSESDEQHAYSAEDSDELESSDDDSDEQNNPTRASSDE